MLGGLEARQVSDRPQSPEMADQTAAGPAGGGHLPVSIAEEMRTAYLDYAM